MNRLIEYYVNPDNKILGEDEALITERQYNYFSQCMIFEKAIPNIDFRIMQMALQWLNTSNSPLRLRIWRDNKRFYYDKSPSQILFKKMVRKADSIDIETVEKYAIENEMTMVLFYSTNTICITCQHMFLDGVTAYNLVQQLYDDDHYFNIKQFKYVPGFHEAGLAVGSFRYWFPVRRYLSYDIDYKNTDLYEPLRFRHRLMKYKEIKRRCISSVSFASVVIAKMLEYTFQVVKSDTISFGVLVGMNSRCRFNNYGVVTCEMTRPRYDESIERYTMRVHKTLDDRKEMALSSFIGSNIYGLDLKYGEIDILFSGMPMTLNKPIKMDGVRLKMVNSNMRHTTMPMYCGYLSCDRYIHFYLNIRTHAIDREKYEELLMGK